MSQTTHDLVDAIISGDSIAIEDAFNATMADKISTRLESMRQDVAQSMFQTEGSCGYKKKMKKEEAELSEEEIVEEMINEVLGKNEPASAWIKDFVDSDNPKFAGKSKEKRKQMALAAYYAKQKNEELDVAEMLDYLSENEEILAELSKKTLGSYVNKASDSAVDSTHAARDAHDDMDDHEVAVQTHKTSRRLQGIAKAAKKLAK